MASWFVFPAPLFRAYLSRTAYIDHAPDAGARGDSMPHLTRAARTWPARSRFRLAASGYAEGILQCVGIGFWVFLVACAMASLTGIVG